MTINGYLACCFLAVISTTVATQLGEDVLTNVALHKNITFAQSDVSEYEYSLAVDGKTNKTTPKGSCISIEADEFIWWQLDLAGTFENECYIASVSYGGLINSTISGKTCQRWDSQSPHEHGYHSSESGTKHFVEDYCRATELCHQPWCFTTDPDVRWEYCGIEPCEEVFKADINLKTGISVDNLVTTNYTVQFDDLLHYWVLVLPANTRARFVDFRHEGIKGNYHLCEVEVFGTKGAVTNVVLDKTAEVSTKFSDSEDVSAITHDLVLDQNLEESSCLDMRFHEGSNWWQVDFGNIYLIFLVRIYNEFDCWSEPAHDLTLLFWNSPERTTSFYVKDIVKDIHQFKSNIEAVFLRVIYSGNEPFYLCEVEVFGQKVECQYNTCLNGGNCSVQQCENSNNCRNYKCSCPTGYGGVDCEMEVEKVASGADIIASSINHSSRLPRNAIDGDTSQLVVNGATCVTTQKEAKPYLIIDLGNEYTLTSVKLYKRLDCCSEDVNAFEIYIMVRIWKSYGFINEIDDSIITFDIYPYVSTRLVRIDGKEDKPAQLQLCEIEVFRISQGELIQDKVELDDRPKPFIQMRFTLTDKYSDVVKSEDSFIYSMREELSNVTGYSVDCFQNTHVDNDPFRVLVEVHPTHGDITTLNAMLEKVDTLLQQGVVGMKNEDGHKLTILAGSLKYHVLYAENTGSTKYASFLMVVIVLINHLQEAIVAWN